MCKTLIFLEFDPSENDADAGNDNDRSDDEQNEEIEDDDGVVEKTFKFQDFAKRLLNPKIVRACVVVLSDWQQIPTKSLKAAVTILHRIAYGCSCPAMLYQAKLFRIFQQVFNAARETHQEELRRLGIFVIRKFVETAPNNPKIYAELMFFKSIKEANELEDGYCDVYNSGIKGTWSEEQEAELRFLFEENQRNPETDKDVIDWILDNLIDKTRTRRGVLKKLKDLGLSFKAPTKKSSANAQNKNLWQAEQDEELRSLYDQHRTEEDCLQRILDEFEGRRNKQQIIKRMIQIHIIADKSEILPQKPRRRKKTMKATNEENDENDGFIEGTSSRSAAAASSKARKAPKPTKKKVIRSTLDVGTVKALFSQIDAEKYQESIDWLKEQLDDAAEEEEQPAEEDDGIPLVPLQQQQKEAMEDEQFQKFLVAIGMQPPVFGMEVYWRIPTYLNSADLKLRAKIVGGEEIEIDVDGIDDDADEDDGSDANSGNEPFDYESEEDYLETLGTFKERKKQENLDVYRKQQREKLNTLMFSKSDEETEERAPLPGKKKAKGTKGKDKPNDKGKSKANTKAKAKGKKQQQESDESAEDPDLVNKIKKRLDKKKRNYDLSSEDEESADEDTLKASKSKEVAKPPADQLFEELKSKRAKNKMNLLAMVAEKNTIAANDETEDNDFNFNSEDYRQRLAELGASAEDDADDGDDDVENNGSGGEKQNDLEQTKVNHSRRANVIESDDEDNFDGDNEESKQSDVGGTIGDIDKRPLAKKRRRSLDFDENSAEAEHEEKNVDVDVDDDDDEDAQFLNRKKLPESQHSKAERGEEPAKRRRLAIIDDDEDDD